MSSPAQIAVNRRNATHSTGQSAVHVVLAQSLIAKDGDPMAKIERYADAAERSYHKAYRQLEEAQRNCGTPGNGTKPNRNEWRNRADFTRSAA